MIVDLAFTIGLHVLTTKSIYGTANALNGISTALVLPQGFHPSSEFDGKSFRAAELAKKLVEEKKVKNVAVASVFPIPTPKELQYNELLEKLSLDKEKVIQLKHSFRTQEEFAFSVEEISKLEIKSLVIIGNPYELYRLKRKISRELSVPANPILFEAYPNFDGESSGLTKWFLIHSEALAWATEYGLSEEQYIVGLEYLMQITDRLDAIGQKILGS